MTLRNRLQGLGLVDQETAIASKLSELGLSVDQVDDADLAKLAGGAMKALANTAGSSPTASTRGRKPRNSGDADAMKLALKKPADEMLAFGKGIEQMAVGAESAQVNHLVNRVHQMPNNVRDGFVSAMAEVESDPASFRQDAEQIFESMFDVSEFAVG